MADQSFGLFRPFHIDDGQLEGETPQQCFVLGYELAQVDGLLRNPMTFARPVHSQNRERIEWACKEANRNFVMRYMADDSSESWLWLVVGSKGVNQ